MIQLHQICTLLEDVKASFWNGKHPVEENSTEAFWPKGTTVKVVMCSRFGDFGITTDLNATHGYQARVERNILE